MAILHSIKIKNFRSIESFEQCFKSSGVTCIIGRGDTGKTTILEAISYVLTSHRYINFYDSDFLNCNSNNTIEIEATLLDLPKEIISKYGDYIRCIVDNEVIDDLASIEAENAPEALTIKLTVYNDLEPSWTVFCQRALEPRAISAVDRSKLNVLYVTDYNDRQFSLNKGTPLYSMLKSLSDGEIFNENIVLDVIREAKGKIDTSIAGTFDNLSARLAREAKILGLELKDLKTSLDQRDITINQNRITLHDGELPLRLKGRGSKRLLSIAIQLAILDESSIILIDEVEYGLEPDRVQHLVNTLISKDNCQVIITTHSSNVITELPCDNLHILRELEGEKYLLPIKVEMQALVRSNPDAFFAKKVVVCEGSTEIGIIRAWNKNRIKNRKLSMTYLGVRYADGAGSQMVERAQGFDTLEYDTVLVCDSDIDDKDNGKIADEKRIFNTNGQKVFDCQKGLSIEEQVFYDVSWECVKKLICLHICIDRENPDKNTTMQSVFQSVSSKVGNIDVLTWLDNDSIEIRAALGAISKKNDWYKNITDGERFGDLIISDLSTHRNDTLLNQTFFKLDQWIDGK